MQSLRVKHLSGVQSSKSPALELPRQFIFPQQLFTMTTTLDLLNKVQLILWLQLVVIVVDLLSRVQLFCDTMNCSRPI